jgi:hypothetical protein
MTAEDNTYQKNVNSIGAHDTDAQYIVALLKQCGGSTTISYLGDLSKFPPTRLQDAIDEMKNIKIIDMCTGLNSVRVYLLKIDKNNHSIVADGSGIIEDLNISISENDMFDLLSAPRRRELIKQLSNLTPKGEEAETHIELKPLATWVVMARTGTPVNELSQSEQHRAYVSLTQVHANSLEENGVAKYHKRVKKITPTEDIHDLATIIESIESATQSSNSK